MERLCIILRRAVNGQIGTDVPTLYTSPAASDRQQEDGQRGTTNDSAINIVSRHTVVHCASSHLQVYMLLQLLPVLRQLPMRVHQ